MAHPRITFSVISCFDFNGFFFSKFLQMAWLVYHKWYICHRNLRLRLILPRYVEKNWLHHNLAHRVHCIAVSSFFLRMGWVIQAFGDFYKILIQCICRQDVPNCSNFVIQSLFFDDHALLYWIGCQIIIGWEWFISLTVVNLRAWVWGIFF